MTFIVIFDIHCLLIFILDVFFFFFFSQSKSSHTLLHLAVMKRFYNFTSFLIQFGANLNAQDINGYTGMLKVALYSYDY